LFFANITFQVTSYFNVTSTGVVTADGKGFVSGGPGVGDSYGSGGELQHNV